MKHIIETPRLILRPPTLEDAEDITREKQKVWDQLQLWMCWAHDGEETLESTHKYLELTFQDLAKGGPHLIARHKETDDLVCMTGVNPYQEKEKEFSTGYWVTKEYLGQGYAVEATGAALKYAFEALEAKAIHVQYFEGNYKSRRIIEKLGFEYVETQINGHKCCLDGRPMNVISYVLKDKNALPELDINWRRE